MADPEMPDKRPAVMELDPDQTYWWCACGKSADQPFCDGSHAGSGFSPIELKVEQKKNFALCKCKRTSTPPFCDGTHSRL